MGVSDHLTCLLRNLNAGQEATVRTRHGTTDWFKIGKGAGQGCVLLPCLFNLYAEHIMWNTGLDEPQFSSVQSLSRVWFFATPWTAARQASLSRAYSNACPLHRWCHPTISSSVIPFYSRLQPFPASGSFSMSRFFASGSQRIEVSASASVLPMNTQDWFPLGLTGWISLQPKGLSRVFSNTTVQKHQFFGTQLSL